MRELTLAQLAPSGGACGCFPGDTHETLPITARPPTTRSFNLRLRPRPVGSSTPGVKCTVGRNFVVWRRKPPSNAGSSATRAGAFFVDPSKTSRDSGGPEGKETDKAALLVSAWTRKNPPVPEEELVESEMLEWRRLWMPRR